MSPQPRRLVFGEVAELYEAMRPTYPDALIADLAAWADAGMRRPQALEVGAGTGKATRLLAAHGVAVTAIEPSAEMAAIARAVTTSARGRVHFIESDFEHADLGERRFPLIYAAQAWHWIEVPRGFELARGALTDGGRLVAFWNRPDWERTALRSAIDDVYAVHVPRDLGRGPYHPGGDPSRGEHERWEEDVAEVAGLGETERHEYRWSIDYTSERYVGLVATHSETRLLDETTRARFLAALGAAIDAHGGTFALPMCTRACVARAVH